MTTQLLAQEHRWLYFSGRNGFCDQCWKQRKSSFKRLVPYVNVTTGEFEWRWRGLCRTHAKVRYELGQTFFGYSWKRVAEMAGLPSIDEVFAIAEEVYPL